MMPASFPFSVGFRALFERGAFELETVFKDGPPESTFVFFPEAGTSRILEIPGHNPYEKELQHFAHCIRGKGDATLLDAQHAVEALRLSLATQQSLRDRGAIDLVQSAARPQTEAFRRRRAIRDRCYLPARQRCRLFQRSRAVGVALHRGSDRAGEGG